MGDVITYKCLIYTREGVPRDAIILRKRDDVIWEDLVRKASIKELT